MNQPTPPTPRTLLVATDLSPAARAMHVEAAAFARQVGARVTLLHVVQTLTPTSQGELVGTLVAPPDPAVDRQSAEEALEVEADAFEGLELELRVVVSDQVARTIADYAQEHGADLVVVSTHGRSGFRRLVLGSVAEAVVRHSHVPVLCIPARRAAEARA